MKERQFVVSFVEEDLDPSHAQDLIGIVSLAITKEFGLEHDISFNVIEID
jgi:hypothetical protein